jgi:hypothetical protein
MASTVDLPFLNPYCLSLRLFFKPLFDPGLNDTLEQLARCVEEADGPIGRRFFK